MWAVRTYILGLSCVGDASECVPVCALACEICDRSASTGTVCKGYCSGNNDRDCTSRIRSNSATTVTKNPNPQHRLCPVLRCYQHRDQVCGTPHPLLVSVGWSALDNLKISPFLRLYTSGHGIRNSRIILLSVCQAPSESSFDKLRLHKLCTSIALRLLLLRDCMTSHGQIQLDTRVLAKLCPHQGFILCASPLSSPHPGRISSVDTSPRESATKSALATWRQANQEMV